MASKDGAVPNYKNDEKAYKNLYYDISINLISKNLADLLFLSDLPGDCMYYFYASARYCLASRLDACL